MKRLLVLRDLRGLSVPELANSLLLQSAFQSDALGQLRFRRPELCKTFSDVSRGKGLIREDIPSCKSWAKDSRASLSASFERLAVDATRWAGRLENNLNVPLNQVCEHSLHAIMCFDLFLAEVDKRQSDNGGDGNESGVGIDIDMKAMLEGSIIPDIESLTKEKFGCCPTVQVRVIGADGVIACNAIPLLDHGVPELLSFVMVELLKNGLEAVLNRYGALDLEDAEMDGSLLAITLHTVVTTEGRHSLAGLTLRDCGGGIPKNTLKYCFDAFYSTSANRSREPSYHYSRMFGVPYSGAGIGLLKSKVFLNFHEANISITINHGASGGKDDADGTTVHIKF